MAARGGVIAILDADLQYDAEDLVKAIELVQNEGWGAVSGWRTVRQDGWDKRAPSLVFNWLMRAAFSVPAHDSNCGLKAFRAEAIRSVILEGEMHRLLLPAIRAAGYSVLEIPIRHYSRKSGHSKYGALRLVTGSISVFGLFLIVKFGWNSNGILCRVWRYARGYVWPRIHAQTPTPGFMLTSQGNPAERTA